MLASPGVVQEAIRAEADGADVVIIDCMLDPALEAARESVSIPVIGAGECGFFHAAQHGKFAIVTVLDRQKRAFLSKGAMHGLSDKLVDVLGIGVNVLDLDSAPDKTLKASTAAAKPLIESGEVDAILFGCTGMLGLAEPLAQKLGIAPSNVVDPLPTAILYAKSLVENPDQNDVDRLSHFPTPDVKPIKGFDDLPLIRDKFARKSV